MIATNLTKTSAIAEFGLGNRHVAPDGKVWRYCQIHASGVAPTVGMWLYRYAVATPWVLSATPESLLAAAAGVTGVCTTVIAVGYYGWVQTGGENAHICTNVTLSTGVAAVGSVAIACSTSGGAKFIVPTTNTEYTNAMMPSIAAATYSETCTASLGYVTGRILLEGI